MMIVNDNTLSKRCNKKAEQLGALKIDNDDIDEPLEEIYRRDKFDTIFDKEDNSNEEDHINSDKFEDNN